MVNTSLQLDPAAPAENFTWQKPGLTMVREDGGEICSVSRFQNQSDEFQHRFKTLFEVSPPGPSELVNHINGYIFWTAPGQWFVYEREENPRRDQELADRLRGFASVTLQTDGWARFRVEGGQAARFLEHACMLDLSPTAFSAGSAARTAIGHFNVFVLRPVGSEDNYIILCLRSFAQSFQDHMISIAKVVTA